MGEPAFNDWRLVSLTPLPTWAVGLVALAAGVAVWLAWRGLKVESRPFRRRLLVGLRIAAAIVAVLLVLEPGLELLATTKIRGRVAVLVDRSDSMELPVRPGGTTRREAAAGILGDGADRAALEERFQVDYFGFADAAVPMSPAQAVQDPSTESAAERTTRGRTQILPALEEAVRAGGSRPLAGVVVVSDGGDNGALEEALKAGLRSDKAKEAAKRIEEFDAPVFTLDVTGGELRDVGISAVKVDDFAFVRNTVEVEVELVQRGFDGRTVPVTLEREGQVVTTAEATLEAGAPTRLKMSFAPDTTGEFVYVVKTPLQDGEAVATNNARSFVLQVIRDRIRVLHVAGRPSWDERFLRMLLKRDPNVDLISFFILRTPYDQQVGSQEEMSLIPFPTDEIFRTQLGTFDLVIFHDFAYRPYNMARFLPGIGEYVKQGGALLMLGGTNSFSEGSYAGTAIEEVLPVTLSATPQEPSDQPFRARLTTAGKRHPVTELAVGETRNEEAWGKLPAVHGINRASARDDAQVLLEHPELTDGFGRPAPVVAVREAGRGRTMAVMTDSSWEWAFVGAREGRAQRAYDDFYQHAIRWLVRDPELTQVRLQAEKEVFAPGEAIGLVTKARERDYRPAEGAAVRLELFDAVRGTPIQSTDGIVSSEGVARIELPALPEGAYRARVLVQRDGQELGTATDAFVVEQAGPELGKPAPRPDLLKFIADSSDGAYQLAGNAKLSELPFRDPERVEVGQRKSRPLWDTAWVLVVLCGLLGTEWFLRRRWGFF